MNKEPLNNDLKKVSANNLRFCLLPSGNPPAHLVEHHNAAYDLWLDVWTNVFTQLKFDTSHLLDDFIRQDLIAVIFAGNVPAAVHLYSFLSIDSKVSRAHSYLGGNFSDLFFSKLARNNVRNIMSMEYMTVHPDWRKSKCDIHLGQVLVGLAAQTMLQFGADAAIAPARRDHKVHELAYAVGGESVMSNVMNHNVPCDLLMCHRDRIKSHTDPAVEEVISGLWAKREYYPACQENLFDINHKKAA